MSRFYSLMILSLMIVSSLVTLVRAQNPPNCLLDTNFASARVDCGFAGITESVCYQRGCCWGGLPAGISGAWCFRPSLPNPSECPLNVPGSSRIDCGFPGITQETCRSKGCCWSPSDQGPWCFNPSKVSSNQGFITRSGSSLMDGSSRFRFISMNVPNYLVLEDKITTPRKVYLMPDPWEQEDASLTIAGLQGRVMRTYTLGMGQGQHITGLRQYNEAAFITMDNAIALAKKYNNRLIIPLINDNNDLGYYGDYGALARFRGLLPSQFYTHPDLIEDMKHLIGFLLNRVNTVTGIPYKNEPTILAWQLGNELGSWTKPPAPDSWKFTMASHIKSIAPRALVMDSTIGGMNRITLESLRSPLIDIFTNHYYGSSSSDIISDAKYIGSFGKVYICGEYGFVNPKWYSEVMENCINTRECSGALLWSLRYHSVDGGFYIHREFGQYYSYHAPGFSNPSVGFPLEEKETMNAVRRYALSIQNANTPYPTPPNPGIATSTLNPSALRWRGSAWASGYNIERMYGTGPWVRLGSNVPDHVKNGDPIFSDTNPDMSKDILYRVQAVGVDGKTSGWTILGKITAAVSTGGFCNYQKPGSLRVDAGFYGITQKQCEDRGACYGPSPDGSGPWCFAKDSVTTTTTTTRTTTVSNTGSVSTISTSSSMTTPTGIACSPIKPANTRIDCGFYGITEALVIFTILLANVKQSLVSL